MLDYVVSIWKSRNFWLGLVVNDLHLRYRRSVLGVGWSLLHPLATALVMGAVFHVVFKVPVRSFLPYLLCGIACWSYLVGAAVGGCQSYIQAEPYIRQHPLPLAVYSLRMTLVGMIHFLIALVLVVVLTLTLRGLDHRPEIFSLSLGVLILMLFGWGLTMLTGFINVVFRDTQHIMEIVFQILFYLTPIMYPVDVLKNSRIAWVLDVNPAIPFLELIRKPILEGTPPSLASLETAALITLGVGVVAALTLSWQQRRVVFHL
jgi:ABC-type polysaccharide/polyol phosphate export permease